MAEGEGWYFVARSSRVYGPISLTKLRGCVLDGAVTGSSRVRRGKGSAWATAGNVAELRDLFAKVVGMRPNGRTLRPQNRCRACGHTWYPRGSNLSRKCPNCGIS